MFVEMVNMVVQTLGFRWPGLECQTGLIVFKSSAKLYSTGSRSGPLGLKKIQMVLVKDDSSGIIFLNFVFRARGMAH